MGRWSTTPQQRVQRVRVCEPCPPRAVVLEHRSGWWTGSLLAWVGAAGHWWAVVSWWPADPDQDAVDVLPAAAVRPFTPRPVRVYTAGGWQDGQLHGWRRRPGGTWEGEVMTWVDRRGSKPATRLWYPAAHIRPA